jgi:hypothetical protein
VFCDVEVGKKSVLRGKGCAHDIVSGWECEFGGWFDVVGADAKGREASFDDEIVCGVGFG